MNFLFIIIVGVGLQVELGDTTYTTNNSAVLLEDIGEDDSNALTCLSNLPSCCRNPSVGQWFYPNETQVPVNSAGEGFYRNRGDEGQVFLRRRSTTLSPLGRYCCQAPTNTSDPNVETFCVILSKFMHESNF